jgi:hypothetical protein
MGRRGGTGGRSAVRDDTPDGVRLGLCDRRSARRRRRQALCGTLAGLVGILMRPF